MKVTASQYAQALEALASEEDVRTVAARFVRFLNRRGERAKLPSIVRSLEALEQVKAGNLPVVITAARALSEDAEKALRAKAKDLYPDAKKLEISFVTDSRLLGGYISEAGSERFDASLRTAKEALARTLTA